MMELKLGDLQVKQEYEIGEVKMAVEQVGGSATPNKETDPTVPAYVKSITEQNIYDWNNKAEKTDIPDISEFVTTSQLNDLVGNINTALETILGV